MLLSLLFLHAAATLTLFLILNIQPWGHMKLAPPRMFFLQIFSCLPPVYHLELTLNVTSSHRFPDPLWESTYFISQNQAISQHDRSFKTSFLLVCLHPVNVYLHHQLAQLEKGLSYPVWAATPGPWTMSDFRGATHGYIICALPKEPSLGGEGESFWTSSTPEQGPFSARKTYPLTHFF